jgi:hypothetical protein
MNRDEFSGNDPGKTKELGRFYLLYRCSGCGETGMSEHTLRRRKDGHGFFDHLDTRVTISGSGLPTADGAGGAERERVLAAAKKRLDAGDFSLVERKVVCPRCSMVQPWSGMGQPWLMSPMALATAAVAFLTLVALRLLSGDPQTEPWMLPSLIPLGIMVVLNVMRAVRRRRRLTAARQDKTNWPTFFAPEDLRALSSGPHAHLAKRYLRRG